MKGAQESLSNWEKRASNFARCRAYVLQAIHALDGPNYDEIRDWIKENKRFAMEDTGRRCRELAREIKPPLAVIKYDGGGRVHVYPSDLDFKSASEVPVK